MAVEVWVHEQQGKTDTRFIFTCVNVEQHRSIFGTQHQSRNRTITPAILDIVYLIT